VTLQVGLMLCLCISVVLVVFLITGSVGSTVFDLGAWPLPVYTGFLWGFSFICESILLFKTKTHIPSILLFVFFLAVPIAGKLSYDLFIEQHGNFFGKQLSFEYPIFVWSLGTAVFFCGVLLGHILPSVRKNRLKFIWNERHLRILLWLCLGAAMLAAIVVIVKIGYVPILQPGIDEVRRSFELVAGRFAAKLSRLFVVAAFISAVLFFLTSHKKLYMSLGVVSLLGTTLYGERLYVFYGIIFFLLILLKFRRPALRQMILYAGVGVGVIAAFIVAAEYRADRIGTDLTLEETIVSPLFTEFSYYAYVVDEISGSQQYLKEDIFLGALALLFPRQVWSVFGVDKDEMMQKYSAIDYFGMIFRDPNGTRITPIGEAFAGYGITWGVGLHMALFGLVFGLLEKAYVQLHKLDARLCLVCFLITVFMWLPITTLSAIIEPALFFGWILIALYVFGSSRVQVKKTTSRS